MHAVSPEREPCKVLSFTPGPPLGFTYAELCGAFRTAAGSFLQQQHTMLVTYGINLVQCLQVVGIWQACSGTLPMTHYILRCLIFHPLYSPQHVDHPEMRGLKGLTLKIGECS